MHTKDPFVSFSEISVAF